MKQRESVNLKKEQRTRTQINNQNITISESSQYAFTCSIRNRQFRAKTGLNNINGHTITHEHVKSRIKDGLSQY